MCMLSDAVNANVWGGLWVEGGSPNVAQRGTTLRKITIRYILQ